MPYSHLSPTCPQAVPADYYAALLAASERCATPFAFYRALGQTFRLVAEDHTAFTTLTLGGMAAKVDYLATQHNLPATLRRALHGARIRCATPPDDAAAYWLGDLAAITRLVEVLTATPVPRALQTVLARAEKLESQSRAEGAPASAVPVAGPPAVLRVMADRWDDETLWAHTAEGTAVTVPLNGAMGDWRYLTRLLHEGAQLNLVAPRPANPDADQDSGGPSVALLAPALIIFEPDYLVDVTAVAGCFEEYSHSPFLALLHRLQARTVTGPILLGNLAGQLLDAEVHGHADADVDGSTAAHAVAETTAAAHSVPEAATTAASPAQSCPIPRAVADAFVADNALSLLALAHNAEVSLDTLLADAAQQHAHIKVALHEGLESHVGRYDNKRVILEPSFISEMLGLQGRMDFLQLDHKVLIEQKAGKGAWNPGGDPDTPRQQLKHYVQMLLYMAVLRYNYPATDGTNSADRHAFLLYSRYAKPLLGLGPAPALLHEALRVRNGIVWYDRLYAREGGRLLERITPDALNQLNAHGVLWDNYQRPALDALLTPIQSATPLERAYFSRFLRFVATEQRTAKVGDNTTDTVCFASKWFSSLADKRETGEIYDSLTLLAVSATPPEGSASPAGGQSVEFVTLSLPAASGAALADTSNFRLGDIVILYSYDRGTDPDCRRTMVHRGVLHAVTPDTITVRLRALQSDATVLTRDAHRFWAVEHDSVESSFSGLYAGLHAFLRAPQDRKDLILLQRTPRVDTTLTLRGDAAHYGAFADLALRVRQARDMFLIIGPPGTGKTSYGMLYTLQEQLLAPGTNVLLLSYTNRAVDEICSKLVEEGIDFLRIGHPAACDPAYRPYLLHEVATATAAAAESPDEALSALGRCIAATRVFVGTTTTMSSQQALFDLKRFDLAIIDEASQILEPHLLALLGAIHSLPSGEPVSAIAKFVMIGDHKQLPAVVQQRVTESEVTDPALRAIGLADCRSSLFERLLRRYGNDPAVTFMLHRQGRMHRDIADFPSRLFYGGLLDVVPLPHQIEDTGERRIHFIPSERPDDTPNPKVNPVEARMIADLAERIATEQGSHDIGIIVPYRNQIAAIRSLLSEPLRTITIDTVERFQGSQRDYIIYGFTVQHRYQLAFLTGNVFMEGDEPIDRKLNVAMTRARRHLYLVGNPELLRLNRTFARLIDYCQQVE